MKAFTKMCYISWILLVLLFLFCSSDFQASMKLLMITAPEGSEAASAHGACLGTYQHLRFRNDNYPMWKLTSQSGSSCYLLHQDWTWVVKKNLNDKEQMFNLNEKEWVFRSTNMKKHLLLPSSPMLSWTHTSAIYEAFMKNPSFKSFFEPQNQVTVTQPQFFASKSWFLFLIIVDWHL